mmetsp:Transcript_82287/g.218338  ORF Transcript_82287/g.218338 Transcript_82287/m.218338 type:complete len:288 (-) Transcript_82287:987-1850(-)
MCPHLFEQRQTPQAREGDLVLHLVAELFGEQRQHPESGLGHYLVALPAGVVRVAQYAKEELVLDAVLSQVAPKQPELLHFVVGQVLQLRHSGRDATDERGEDDQAEHQASDGEGPLPRVAGLHRHAGRSELRQTPVKTCRVAIAQRLADKSIALDPVGKIQVHSKRPNGVPRGGQDMVHHEQHQEELRDVHRDEHKLRVDAVPQHRQDALELRQPQEAGNPDHPGGSQDLALPISCAVSSWAGRLKHPIGANREQINQEPCPKVVQEDPPRLHHCHPLVDKAGQARH